MAVSFVGAGSASAAGLTTTLEPSLPVDVQDGDLMLCLVSARNATCGTPVVSGWDLVASAGGHSFVQVWLFSRIKQSGDIRPDVVGQDTTGTFIAQVCAFRGVDPTTPIASVGADSNGASDLTIGPISGVTTENDGAVVLCAAFANDWTTVDTASGDGLTWARAFDFTTTAGGDGSILCDYALTPSSTAVTDKSITVTSGNAGPDSGFMVSLNPEAPPPDPDQTVEDRGTANSISSTTSLDLTPTSDFVGDLAVLLVVADNFGFTANIISGVNDTKGNTWTKVDEGLYSPGGAAGDGICGALFTSPQDGGILTTADTITVTFGVATTSKAAQALEVRGGLSYKGHAFGAGVSAGGAWPSITSSSLAIDDVVIGMIFAASNDNIVGDSDTTNGTWSEVLAATANTGSDPSSASIRAQWKEVTGAGTQTWDISYGDLYLPAWIAFSPAVIADPTTANLDTTTFAPSVQATQNVYAEPDVAALSTAAFAPTVLSPRVSIPSSSAVVLSAFAPAAKIGVTLTPDTGSLALSAFVPTIANPQSVSPATASLSLTTQSPSLPQIFTPDTLALTLTGPAPAITSPRIVTPDTASLSLTELAGQTIAPQTQIADVASLALTSFAPAIVGTRRILLFGIDGTIEEQDLDERFRAGQFAASGLGGAAFDAGGALGTNFGDPVNDQDVATKAYVDSQEITVSAQDKILGRKTPDSVTYVGVGNASANSAGIVTPSLPSGVSPGDVMLLLVTARSNTTTFSVPGWTLGASSINSTTDASSTFLFWRVYQAGDGSPTVTPTGATAGQTIIGQIAAFRGVNESTPFSSIGTSFESVSQTDIGPITGVTTMAAGAVLVFGHRGDDWLSVDPLSGDSLTWAEIGEQDSISGNDAGNVWDYALTPTATTVSDKTFTISGGAANATTGFMVALRPANESGPGGPVEEIDCTPFARTLLDDATAAAARTTLDVYSTSDVVSIAAAYAASAVATHETTYDHDSFLVAADLAPYQLLAQKDSANGYAGLDASGNVNANRVSTSSIEDGAVTNAKRANMADSTISGRAAGAGPGAPQDLTATQVRAILEVMTSDEVVTEIQNHIIVHEAAADPHTNYANKTLSNLTSPTAVNQHLLPSGSRNLGSVDSPWQDVHLDNIIMSGYVLINGSYGIDAFGAGFFSAITTGTVEGISTNMSGAYYVDSVKVVDSRQPAIIDASATTASNTTKINEILAALRAHGLIAP